MVLRGHAPVGAYRFLLVYESAPCAHGRHGSGFSTFVARKVGLPHPQRLRHVGGNAGIPRKTSSMTIVECGTMIRRPHMRQVVINFSRASRKEHRKCDLAHGNVMPLH